MAAEFVHLHVHSQYSLLDGALKVKDLVARTKALGMRGVALTDHGSMFSAIQLYKTCKEQGIQAILGCEVNVARARSDTRLEAVDHLVLLASSEQGYKNLVRVVSQGHVAPASPIAPSVTLEFIAQYRAGLIGLTGCMGGVLAQRVLSQGDAAGRVELARLRDVFEPGALYVELQDHGLPEQSALNGVLVHAARDMGLPLVATNDAHFASREDGEGQLYLSCIAQNRTYAEAEAAHHGSFEMFLKSPREMGHVFRHQPDALRATLEIAERCAIKLKLGVPMLPHFPALPEGVSAADYFRQVAREGLDRRFTEGRIESVRGLRSPTSPTMAPAAHDVRWEDVSRAEGSDDAAAPGGSVEPGNANVVPRERSEPGVQGPGPGEGAGGEEPPCVAGVGGAQPPSEIVRSDTYRAYRARLELELEVIVKMDFPGYFLIVWDFIRFAKEKGIPVGPGRGSGAGSIVAYAMRITDLDPIPYNLLFERFLNPERVSMPDFDIDFCMERRDEVIAYVSQRYGKDSVGQIATFHELKAKSAVKDVARAMGFPAIEAQKIANLIPFKTPGVTFSVGEALVVEPKLKALRDSDPAVAELLKQAQAIEGLTRHAGMHAAGVVLSEGPLWDHVPCFKNDELLVTQYSMSDVESAGLVKFDFLGLKTLTVIDVAVRLVNQRPDRARGSAPGTPARASALDPAAHDVREESGSRAVDGQRLSGERSELKGPGPRPWPGGVGGLEAPRAFDLSDIPLDDPATFLLLQSGETTGVFQLESNGMQELFKGLKPDAFEDIIAAVALYRPGPLGSGMVSDFVDCKHHRKPIEKMHPLVDQLLAPTYGVIVYQEQVMQVAQHLAGYTLGGADLLRRAMGKKKPEEMAKQKATFVSGSVANGVKQEDAERIFALLEFFAGYGFNKSHSAAYALLTYQTAYLKAHYPVEFLCARMTVDRSKTEKVVHALAEGRAWGIDILPPEINASQTDFAVVYGSPSENARRARFSDPLHPRIRFGLGALRGVGDAALAAILEARAGGPFADLFDFAQRVDPRRVNKSVFEALVQSGAFDESLRARGVTRARAFAAIDRALERSRRASKARESGQASLLEI